MITVLYSAQIHVILYTTYMDRSIPEKFHYIFIVSDEVIVTNSNSRVLPICSTSDISKCLQP